MLGNELMFIPITAGCAGLSCIAILYRLILKESPGSPKMRSIAGFIQEGANAFLRREVSTIAYFLVPLAVLLFLLLGWQIALGFVLGASFSVLAMLIGMNAAVRANVRTTNAAITSAGKALQLAFRGGGVMGLAIVSLEIVGVSLVYLILGAGPENQGAVYLLVGFGFGASLAALFAQLGGGIFTKAADVGADLVGKIETKIPEDDPRNPAVIADLVGDNVGDCAGRGADLFESGSDNLIAVVILGLLFVGPPFNLGWKIVLFPFIIRSFGIFATIAGVTSVRNWRKNSIISVDMALLIAGVTSVLGFYVVSTLLMNDMRFFYCLSLGLFTAFVVYFIVQYFTGINHSPVKTIADSAQSGAAISLMTGVSYGMISAAIPIIFIGAVITVSYFIFGGGLLGVCGIIAAALGLTEMKGIIMSSDTFGPIVDNAGGIAKMSGLEKDVDKSLDELDAVGNTTKAVTKGFSMAAAVMTSFALLFAFISDAFRIQTGALPTSISQIAPYFDLASPLIIVGVLIGATIPFIFSGMAILAVGRTSRQMVNEVRRQFESIPGLLEGKAKPDYAKCVDVSTKNSLKEMILPTLLGLIAPIVVGFAFGIWTLAAFLLSATVVGALLATYMFNTGGALDNSKKYIESGKLGKETLAHDAAVTGDVFGDPLKDTAGPSLHILIKLLNIVSITLLPLFIALKL
ncbi:MAG TPA: sodium-translocating pyrophosphatase [candidate division Zixibacteria bacterium]|nr:sodium-translocating pyrophosphatase [candidate division Zixibacteria bacterium]